MLLRCALIASTVLLSAQVPVPDPARTATEKREHFIAFLIQSQLCEGSFCDAAVDCPQITKLSADGSVMFYTNLRVGMDESSRAITITDSMGKRRYTDLNADGLVDLLENTK